MRPEMRSPRQRDSPGDDRCAAIPCPPVSAFPCRRHAAWACKSAADASPTGLTVLRTLRARHSAKAHCGSRTRCHSPRSTPMRAVYLLTAAAFLTLLFGADRAFSEGNETRGQRVFGACAACHSLQPDQSMTGPSLAGLWNRKAGSLASFSRYSPALKSANIVWNDKTLDDWITNPQHLVPGNEMTFDGIKDARQRADLLAFLKEATQHRVFFISKCLIRQSVCRKSATAKIPTQSLQPMDTRANFGSAISA